MIASLREEIHRTLSPLFPHDRPTALLEFPGHDNPGDSAIWLGATSYLSEAAVPVVYLSDRFRHSPRRLARRLDNGTILLQGGGNLGDLYPWTQRFREDIIDAFPQNRIVQMPQSIHFASNSALEWARRAFGTHPDFTLLVRDRSSLEFARREFSCRSLLCPDMAFNLGDLSPGSAPVAEISLVLRSDVEGAIGLDADPGLRAQAQDWPTLSRNLATRAEFGLRRLVGRLLGALVSGPGRRSGRLRSLSPRVFDSVARRRVDAGCELLGSGRVVVTDRLHGHILSLLLGRPHVLLDNSYGKVRAFYETWTSACEITAWADSIDQVDDLAHGMSRSLAA